jgi:hypothetical protein
MTQCSFEPAAASLSLKPGVCAFFADPSENALQANVFWTPESYRRVLPAYVRSTSDSGFGTPVALCEFDCRKALLKAVNGEQHLLIRNERWTSQLRCVGRDIRVRPFSLELVVDEFPYVSRRHQNIRRFADLYCNQQREASKSDWTIEATRHRNALVALDQRAKKRTYRQVAILLYGDEAVQDDWTHPNQTMKNRIIRSVKRGLRMMNGGYRSLLL